MDAEVLVLVLCLKQAADNKDRDLFIKASYLFHELGTGHTGHNVIRDDEVNGSGIFLVPILLKSPFRTKNRDHKKTGALEDRLSRRRLHCIVINEQNRCLHAVPVVSCLRAVGRPELFLLYVSAVGCRSDPKKVLA